MVSSRAVTAVVGLLGGLLVSVAAWVFFDTVALFVLLPFVPFLFRRSGNDDAGAGPRDPPKECPSCGFQTHRDDFTHCPRDGRRLEQRRNSIVE